MKTPFDVRTGTLHKMNQGGTLIVKEYVHSTKVIVQFVRTGFTTHAESGNIRKGEVKDLLQPIIYGVGFVGTGHYSYVKDKKPHQTWRNMLRRCHCEKTHLERPTYVDCSTVKEWHNFQTFCEWYYVNHPKDGGEYHLDKDMIVEGNKVYGPDTCSFVSPTDNAVEANAKYYTFVSPEGDVVEVYNLSEFCREKNLSQTNMSAVHLMKRKVHKGWTKA